MRADGGRRAVKYRRSEEIIIAIHAGRGWFDPLSDAKGDVFKLVEHLDSVGFPEALVRVAELVGFDAVAHHGAPVGTVRLNVSRLAAELILMPNLLRFNAMYPSLRLEIVIDDALTDVVAKGRSRFEARCPDWRR